MNNPNTWDEPMLFFDSGLSWDGNPNPEPIKHIMSKFKAYVSFNQLSNADLQVQAGSVKDQMTANAATFDDPPVTMADFAAQNTSFSAALLERTTRAAAAVVALRTQRASMLASLRLLGNYVNNVAQGSEAVLVLSGFPYYNTQRAPIDVPPLPPANLRLSRGTASGMVIVRCTPARYQLLNEVQVNLSDPLSGAQWEERGTFYNGRVTLTGFDPGIMVWVRVRTQGRKDMMSDWSETSQIRTL